jgi:restriction system protein
VTQPEKHVVFHYPPEVLQNLKNVIPLLNRSKKDVLSFFQGAGVEEVVLSDLRMQVQTNPDGISKYEIARTVLERLNVKKDDHLRELREVVRRVTEVEEFSMCWPNDQLKARGLVAELREIVEVKDAFTRMRIEREQTAKWAKEDAEQKAQIARAKGKGPSCRQGPICSFQ